MSDGYRFVLKPWVTRGLVEYMALDYAWVQDTIHARDAFGPFYKTWVLGIAGDTTEVLYGEDDFAELRYIQITGPLAARVAEDVCDSIDVYRFEEIREHLSAASDYRGWTTGLTLLGASLTRELVPWACDMLQTFMQHADPRVRLAAIAAVGYPRWKAFVPGLEALVEGDPDPRVTRRAKRMIELIFNEAERSPVHSGRLRGH